MSEEEFDSQIRQGRKLLILDNLVIDIERFLNKHPGGQWNIHHNIGKDVSKFFYGGYSIDDNEERPGQGHRHSNFARKAVAQLAIARYCQGTKKELICTVQPINTINDKTQTFQFKAKETTESFRKFYPGLSTLGKNFTITSVPEVGLSVSRQYSICYSLTPEILSNLV